MKVIFPGTFDPLTNGHLDLIVRASKMFDEVIVLIAENTSKKTLFSFEERKLLIEDEIKALGNVSVIASPHDLTVDASDLFAESEMLPILSMKNRLHR